VAQIERVMFGGRGQGSLTKYSNSPYYFSCYRVHGKEHRESTGTPDQKSARRIHKQKLDALAADRKGLMVFTPAAKQRATVAERLDAWERDLRLRGLKSASKAIYHSKPMREHFGTWRVTDVTPAAVDRYIEQCREAGLAPATCNRRVQTLASALHTKFRKLSEVGNQRTGFFERDAFERLVAVLPDYLRDAARFAYITSWRKSEVVGLRWNMVNLAGGTLTIPTSKNGEPRTIPLVGGLGEILQRREAARLVERNGQPVVSDFVFHKAGRCLGDFKRAWNTARGAAGLPDGLVHDFRRTAVRNFEQAGVPRSVAMKITGHKTEAVYRRYAIVASKDMERALETVSATIR
jgi:integrase